MKATGIVRKVDLLGRVVVPMEIRRTFGIDIKDPLEIFTDGDKIILRKYQPGCVICGETENVRDFKNKNICSACVEELSNQAV
ncbi:AbrB/MazE/SpoVT family DNA-binding domain-containing protein [Bacillus mycoides]|uniref:AbrB/MazE/SpoVT family DNA-binding domain-containing protein n=1 Tax=Bacillus mycoides TaxID=1405 RepID=UPI0009931856|nr:AbrB/MazE/SpoVT family DNA-binding domain-containing protein [Bacillus mycoides]OOR55300.1 AbrB family transcriptional regulator [Bacillus mycoides]